MVNLHAEPRGRWRRASRLEALLISLTGCALFFLPASMFLTITGYAASRLIVDRQTPENLLLLGIVLVHVFVNIGGGALAFAAVRRQWVPLTPGHCVCGYNLTGNLSGRCPECGTGQFASSR